MAAAGYNHVRQTGAMPPAATRQRSRRERSLNDDELELRLAALERERREFYQELFEAAQVQRRLSGPRQWRRGKLEIASEVFPVRHLAGDFVTAMDIAGRTWVALGDIAGKGLAAAMWFTHLTSLIACYASSLSRPAAVMSAINADLCRLQPAPPLTSMVLFVLDAASAQVEYCNAGHPAPLVVRDGAVEPLEAGGPLLGVVSGAGYESAQIELHSYDLLIGFTDGVTECRNSKDEEFGQAHLLCEVKKHSEESAQALLFFILGAVQDFAGERPRQDDVSLLVIRAGNH